MAYTHDTTNWAMPPRRTLLGRIGSYFKARKKQHVKRLEYECLLRANDHMLRDIGLTCDDVKDALNRPRRWF